MDKSNPNIAAQLLAQMQAVENLRQQNAVAAQNLAVQLQNLAAAQAHSQGLVGMRPALIVPPPAIAFSAPAFMPAALGSSALPVLPVIAVPQLGATAVAIEARSSGASAGAEAREEEEDKEVEVPRCHLHRKPNKACKFCKAFIQVQELEKKKQEEKKHAVVEKLKEGKPTTTAILGEDDKAPLPNLGQFPPVMQERILKSDFYNSKALSSTLAEIKDILYTCGTCDTESRSQSALDLEPSSFICTVYRMLQLHLTEGLLQTMFNSRSCWIRCAGFMYVRLGIHQDRYWELLSDALMDDEEFVPFPGRGGESMSVGQYVQEILAKDKYANINLPRIAVAQRRTINKRLVLYGQFRKRYAANLEVLERYENSGTQVEICSPDGEWSPADTVGSTSTERRVTTALVRLSDATELHVSIGMLISPSRKGNSDPQDLTRSRGRSTEELLQKYQDQQKDSAVASGKDYCKTSGQHTMRVGGVPFVAGVKRKMEEEDVEEEMRKREMAKESGPSMEHRAKMAAIESKYCARVVQSKSGNADGSDGADRLRLG